MEGSGLWCFRLDGQLGAHRAAPGQAGTRLYPKLPAQGGARAERHPSRHPAVLPFASPSPGTGPLPAIPAHPSATPPRAPSLIPTQAACVCSPHWLVAPGFWVPDASSGPTSPEGASPQEEGSCAFLCGPVLCVQGLAGERISGSFITSRTPGGSQGGRAQQVGGASSPARGRGRVPKASHPVCARAGTGSRDTRMGPPWSHEPQPGRIWRELEQGKEGNAWGEADP